MINTVTDMSIWYDTNEKKLKNMGVSFDVIQDCMTLPPDHQLICCHMIVDIKMESFCCKANSIPGEI